MAYWFPTVCCLHCQKLLLKFLKDMLVIHYHKGSLLLCINSRRNNHHLSSTLQHCWIAQIITPSCLLIQWGVPCPRVLMDQKISQYYHKDLRLGKLEGQMLLKTFWVQQNWVSLICTCFQVYLYRLVGIVMLNLSLLVSSMYRGKAAKMLGFVWLLR